MTYSYFLHYCNHSFPSYLELGN